MLEKQRPAETLRLFAGWVLVFPTSIKTKTITAGNGCWCASSPTSSLIHALKAAGEKVYRLVTTLLDPFLYPAKEVAVLYHERWHVEVVIDETRTHMRLSARTLRSLTPEGVLQEIYALLLAHTVVRTLMLQAAEQAQIPATQISFTETIRIMDESLIPLGLVAAPRRLHMVEGLIREIGLQRLPKQRVRIQPRVVKRVRSRYERKKPEHLHAPPLELDLDFHHIIDLVDSSLCRPILLI